ncbi:MAG: BrnA antitoxin family protein [Azonexus sp.]|nr:BrnA antitoxin family protein [Azonexus sp.]
MKDSHDFSVAQRGAVLEPKGKRRITIWVDDAVLDTFRARAAAQGKGYQTLINEALRAIASNDEPLTLAALRQVIREELHPA